MKKHYVCLKDWKLDTETFFFKGKSYEGKLYNQGNSAKMNGERNMKVNFHKGSEYFDI